MPCCGGRVHVLKISFSCSLIVSICSDGDVRGEEERKEGKGFGRDVRGEGMCKEVCSN